MERRTFKEEGKKKAASGDSSGGREVAVGPSGPSKGPDDVF